MFAQLRLVSMLVFFLLISIEATPLPSFIKPCRRNLTDFETCVMDLVRSVKGRLPQGIPELKIQSLDPLNISRAEFDPEYGLLSIQYAIFTNITTIGSTNFVLKNLSINFEKLKFIIDVDFSDVKVKCNYNISASTLLLPILSDGYFEGNFTNISSHNILYGEYYNKDDKKHLKIIDQIISLDIGSSSVHLEDSGNPVKNVLMNDFWPALFTVIKPTAEIKIGQIAVSFVKEMLQIFDIDSLAPE